MEKPLSSQPPTQLSMKMGGSIPQTLPIPQKSVTLQSFQSSGFWFLQVLSFTLFLFTFFSLNLHWKWMWDGVFALIVTLVFSSLTTGIFHNALLSVSRLVKNICTTEEWFVTFVCMELTKLIRGDRDLEWVIIVCSFAMTVISSLKAKNTVDNSGFSDAFALCAFRIALTKTIEGRVSAALVAFFFLCPMVGAIMMRSVG